MGKAVVISDDEKRWRAEDDARALKRAQEIQLDKSRMKEAKKVIKEDLTKISKVAENLGLASNTSKKSSTAKKSNNAKKSSTSTTKKTSKPKTQSKAKSSSKKCK